MTRKMLTVMIASMLMATGLVSAAAQLPANEWTKIGQNDAGVRRGSAVVWLEKAKKFYEQTNAKIKPRLE